MSATFEYSKAAIFSRLVEAELDDLSPELARHILGLKLSQQDMERANILLRLPSADLLRREN